MTVKVKSNDSCREFAVNREWNLSMKKLESVVRTCLLFDSYSTSCSTICLKRLLIPVILHVLKACSLEVMILHVLVARSLEAIHRTEHVVTL